MMLKQQLHQRQVQRLILAPALQQAIKLLPLTNLDLIEVIDEELAQNPMLEIEEETSDEKKDAETSQESDEADSPREREAALMEKDDGSETSKSEEDKEFEAYFQEYFDNGLRTYSHEKKEAPILENFVSKSTSLWDHLNWQANLTFSSAKDKDIAQYIIGNINDDGYLTSSVEEISQTMEASPEIVESIRKKIMRLDPLGAGSLNVSETLLVQLEYFGIENPVIREIIEFYLPLLEKSDFAQLAKKLAVTLDELKKHIDIIKKLEPTPGRKFNHEKTFYIVPDIIVKKEDGMLNIYLNDEGLPRLRINGFYRTLMTQSSKENSEACRFLKEKMKKAFWFMRSLDQRNQTIYKVAKHIVDKQRDFLERGIEYIKPLTLIELAQEIGVHESTVGRVVSNKYMMTPRGVFPLKYFFHKSLTGDFGEEVSSLRVKERIKKLLETEDHDSPLSDIEIGDILAKENFNIARRTVAKYRKQLRLSPSHIRKRQYWMEGTS